MEYLLTKTANNMWRASLAFNAPELPQGFVEDYPTEDEAREALTLGLNFQVVRARTLRDALLAAIQNLGNPPADVTPIYRTVPGGFAVAIEASTLGPPVTWHVTVSDGCTHVEATNFPTRDAADAQVPTLLMQLATALRAKADAADAAAAPPPATP
jgi:hypothetical protein